MLWKSSVSWVLEESSTADIFQNVVCSIIFPRIQSIAIIGCWRINLLIAYIGVVSIINFSNNIYIAHNMYIFFFFFFSFLLQRCFRQSWLLLTDMMKCAFYFCVVSSRKRHYNSKINWRSIECARAKRWTLTNIILIIYKTRELRMRVIVIVYYCSRRRQIPR